MVSCYVWLQTQLWRRLSQQLYMYGTWLLYSCLDTQTGQQLWRRVMQPSIGLLPAGLFLFLAFASLEALPWWWPLLPVGCCLRIVEACKLELTPPACLPDPATGGMLETIDGDFIPAKAVLRQDKQQEQARTLLPCRHCFQQLDAQWQSSWFCLVLLVANLVW